MPAFILSVSGFYFFNIFEADFQIKKLKLRSLKKWADFSLSRTVAAPARLVLCLLTSGEGSLCLIKSLQGRQPCFHSQRLWIENGPTPWNKQLNRVNGGQEKAFLP